MTPSVEALAGGRFAQGESPRWLGDDRLVWVDMATGSLLLGRLTGAGLSVTTRLEFGDRIGCAAPVAGSDDVLVAAGRDLVRVSPLDERTAVAALPPGLPWFNDGVGDPSGRFWIGTQAVPREPVAALYSLEPDGSLLPRLTGVTVSNGICLSSDGRTLYYIDTLPDRAIDAFTVDADGSLRDRRRIAVVEGGNPDGMAIDVEGCLWVAVWGASEVRRYSPSGCVLERVEVPAVQPSAVALVGSTLVITTAAVGLRDPRPVDGMLLAVSVSVPGVPTAKVRLSQ